MGQSQQKEHTRSMQAEKCGLENQLLGGQNRADSCLSGSWGLISHNLQRGWQHIKMRGYTQSSPQLPAGETSPAGMQNCYRGIQSTRADCLTSLQFQRRMPVNAI